MKSQLRNVRYDIFNENTDEMLFLMIDNLIEKMQQKHLSPNKIHLTICEYNAHYKIIWLSIIDSGHMQAQESIWINEYDYSMIGNNTDETLLAKEEVYRLKKILKKHYPNWVISSDLRGC